MPPHPSRPSPADGPETGHIDTFPAHRRVDDSHGTWPDRRIGQLAELQHGLVTLGQLEDVGLSSAAVRKRLQRGRLHRVHQGIYAVGHPLLSRHGRWTAAVLACGSEAVLSHRSAAALWGLRESSRSKIDVTAPGRRGRIPAGIDAHRHGSLRPQDRTIVDGIPCTSVARTLLDFAAVVQMRELQSAIAQAEVLRLFDLGAAQELIRRSRGRRGVARLRRAIAEHDPASELTRSELERRFLAVCRRAGLAPPAVNAPVTLPGGDVVADFLWREARLIVEADSHRFHGTSSAFERDRRRDQRLQLAGWRVIRCTWRQVVDEPGTLVTTLRGLLLRA